MKGSPWPMYNNLPPTHGDHLKLLFIVGIHCEGDTEHAVNSPIKAKVVFLDIRKERMRKSN